MQRPSLPENTLADSWKFSKMNFSLLFKKKGGLTFTKYYKIIQNNPPSFLQVVRSFSD